MPTAITATMLYDLVQCPHRVALDLFEDPTKEDPISPFVQLLWERGHAYEQEVIERLKIPFLNLRPYSDKDREHLTREALSSGESLIYGGRIRADDLLGEPDLLRKTDNGYLPGDIKSGAALEGLGEDADKKPKKHYAVQLALYSDILQRVGLAAGRKPFVWESHGEDVPYDLDAPQGPKTQASLWDEYQSSLTTARSIIARAIDTLPSYGSECKLCHWRSVCSTQLEEMDDLTLIPDLGRSRRDSLAPFVGTVRDLAATDLSSLIQGKKTIIPGIGPKTLQRFHARAQLQVAPNSTPYFIDAVGLPPSDVEVFFDVETDPMNDICYLHGFLERHRQNPDTEKYVSFFAETATLDGERRAFSQAWEYIQELQPSAFYYYAAYERTVWRRLVIRHPSVAQQTEVETLFDSNAALDLYYDVVRPKMEWPTRDLSLKTLATRLGFSWRDPDPSQRFVIPQVE